MELPKFGSLTKKFAVEWNSPDKEHQSASVELDADRADVLVVEVRNRSPFEEAMRGKYLEGKPVVRETGLVIDFDQGESILIDPVGTKFLRRIIVPVPSEAGRVTFRAEGEFWYMRRAWLGRAKEPANHFVESRPLGDVPSSLGPMESADLEFIPGNIPIQSGEKLAHVMRLEGYYEFLMKSAMDSQGTRN